MQMSAGDIKKFPKFAAYVSTKMPEVRSIGVIISTIQRLAGTIDRATITNALVWGRGPMIKVVKDLGADGEFTPDIGSNEIRIDEKRVLDFEKGKGLVRTGHGKLVYLVGVILLHELTHWADDQDGVDTPGEEGWQFEDAVYGGIIE